MPPPTPVPIATNTAVSQPRAAPSSDSARAKARASLISAVGASSASASRATTGTPGQPPGMFVRKVVVPLAASKRPGTPMPTVSTGTGLAAGGHEPADDAVGPLGGAGLEPVRRP